MTTVQANHEEALARLRSLPGRLAADAEFRAALDGLEANKRASFDGVVGASRTLLAAALRHALRRPIVILCAQSRQIDEIVDEWQLFQGGQVDTFPPWEAESADREISDEIFGLRLRTLKALSDPATIPEVLVTSIQSLQQTVPSPAAVSQQTRVLNVGQRIDPEAFRRWLVENGFQPTTAVALPGEFSWR